MIIERMSKDGEWLFRYRGQLPFLLLLPGLWTLSQFEFLAGSKSVQQVWDWICLSVSVCGLVVRATTVGCVSSGTSGRNTAFQRATELNTTGWYSIVRNPLYLGNYLVMLGIILVPADWALVAITGCLFWIYYERIISAEEAFLYAKFGEPYAQWARSTPAFFPRLHGWKSPALAFNWRMLLRREYTCVLLIGTAFLLLNFLQHLVAENRYYVDRSWLVMFTMCFAVYLALRSLKKYTQVLKVE